METRGKRFDETDFHTLFEGVHWVGAVTVLSVAFIIAGLNVAGARYHRKLRRGR